MMGFDGLKVVGWEPEVPESVERSYEQVPQGAKHREILNAMEGKGWPVVEKTLPSGDKCWHVHTAGLKECHEELGLAGEFDTVSRGTDRSIPNCFAFLRPNGEFYVSRLGNFVEPGWNQRDGQGSWCMFNAAGESPLALTDELRLARHLLSIYSRNGVAMIRYFEGQWFIWDEYYRPLDDEELRNLIYTECKAFLMEGVRGQFKKNGEPVPAPQFGRAAVANVELALSSLVRVKAVGWVDGRQGNYMAFADKILNRDTWVERGEVDCVDQTPGYFDPHTLPYTMAYTEREPVLLLAKLREQFKESEVQVVQEFGGCCMTTDNNIQKMLAIIGPPRSFKGTLLRVIEATIGEHNVAAKSLESFVSPHAMEDLPRKTLLAIADSRPDPQLSRKAVERLLGISGQDKQNINPKGKKHYTAVLPCKIALMSNILPDFADPTGALLSRFLLLKTTVSYVDREDSTLLDSVLEQQNEIVWWFLRGLRRLMSNGRYTEPDNDLKLQFRYKNNPVSSFIASLCEVTGVSDDKMRRDALYEAFEDWAAQYQVPPMDKNVFFRELYAAVPRVRGQDRYIAGIRWASPPTEASGSELLHHLAA